MMDRVRIVIDTGDGTFDNPGDRKIIGNNSLRLQYGINLGVNYKGFDLSVLLQGVGKRDVWISDARRWPFNSGQFGSLFKDQLDYWKPVDSANGDWTAANPNAEYFRIYGQRKQFRLQYTCANEVFDEWLLSACQECDFEL